MYFVLFIPIFSCSKFSLCYKECKKIDDCSCLTDEGEISLKKTGRNGNTKVNGRTLLILLLIEN